MNEFWCQAYDHTLFPASKPDHILITRHLRAIYVPISPSLQVVLAVQLPTEIKDCSHLTKPVLSALSWHPFIPTTLVVCTQRHPQTLELGRAFGLSTSAADSSAYIHTLAVYP